MAVTLGLPRWNDVLVEIHRCQEKYCYCEKLNRVINGSLTHLREIVKALELKNIIEIKPTKKIRMIKLTEKGKRIISALLQLKEEL